MEIIYNFTFTICCIRNKNNTDCITPTIDIDAEIMVKKYFMKTIVYTIKGHTFKTILGIQDGKSTDLEPSSTPSTNINQLLRNRDTINNISKTNRVNNNPNRS